MKQTLFLAVLVLVVPAHADVYKCVGDDGATTFSQTPCSASAEKVAVASKRSSTGSADCSFAENFARTTSRLMRQGVDKDRFFEQYGGPEAFDNGTTRMVNYVYQYRDTQGLSQDRIAELAVAQCNSGAFGGLTCESLPKAYTDSGGGCGGSFSAETAYYDVDTFAIHREKAEARRREQAELNKKQADERKKYYAQQKRAAECRKPIEQEIAEIEVLMSMSSDPRKYRSKLKRLRAQLEKCGPYTTTSPPEVQPQPGGYHRLRRR
ncbi:MAG: DUF4124 domain-containing protein [Woeseiaceae bacterium]|nr:DUF4124 domain-containing protein [Woeseiaceae bacterium]